MPLGDPATGRKQSVYDDPLALRFVDSLEGVPPPPVIEPWARSAWRRALNRLLAGAGLALPGVALSLGIAVAGAALAAWFGERVLGFEHSPLSPVLLAIIVGLALRNLVGLPAVYDDGLRLSLRTVLRVGVALLGIRLSLAAVGSIGIIALPIVIGCIAAAILAAGWISARLSLPPRLGTLIAVGTGICGNSAIMATAPLIEAEEDEVSYAVGCISLFGMLALLVYPFLSYGLFAGEGQGRLAGVFLGTSIHDTAQVAGAGMVYMQNYGDPSALEAATVTKLLRNLCMLVVIPLMAVLHRRRSGGRPLASVRWSGMLPLFVLGFLAMSLLRTAGDLGDRPFGLLSRETWLRAIDSLNQASSWCLAVAMAAVGLSTSLRRLRQLGLRPLAAGLLIAALVGAVSFILVSAMAWRLRSAV